eukprot:TRINITY_DN13413_c0_g1_i2.p1 TRINITY_DN13413_c0_g1~~TRINITY_DN13413_c0_g1_i2.p1  ORF type:complete len:278 (+),score=57.23 TRINITY_DN13413_c0_g1_i2:794-1627(+)
MGNGKDRNKFDGSKSSSFKNLNTDDTLQYGRGNVVGTVVQDDVSVSFLGKTVAVKPQAFVQASSITDSGLANTYFDGVMGLAQAGALSEGQPWYLQAPKQNDISDVFSVYISKDVGKKGAVVFGGVVPAFNASGFHWHNLLPGNQYWAVKLTGVSVTGSTPWACSVPTCTAIVDSGTSLIMLPTVYLSAWPSVQSDCSNVGSLPAVSFTLDSQVYVFEGADYVLKRSGQCESALQQTTGSMTILGQAFIRKYYSAFDPTNNRVGLALANHNWAANLL